VIQITERRPEEEEEERRRINLFVFNDTKAGTITYRGTAEGPRAPAVKPGIPRIWKYLQLSFFRRPSLISF
jgi:hypothetical protein